MKRFFALLVAAVALLSFAACEKEGNETPKNEFKIGDQTYPINYAEAYCFQTSDHPGIREFDIYLCDKDYLDDNDFWPDDGDPIYANGHYFNIYYLGAATNTPVIPSGKYTFGELWTNQKHSGESYYSLYTETGSFKYASYFGQEENSSNNLEITVKHIKDDVYEIIVTGGLDENGKTVSGYYKGKVQMIEREW